MLAWPYIHVRMEGKDSGIPCGCHAISSFQFPQRHSYSTQMIGRCLGLSFSAAAGIQAISLFLRDCLYPWLFRGAMMVIQVVLLLVETVLYDHGLHAPAQTRGRHRRTWRQVVDCIWRKLAELSKESWSLPRPEFTQDICSVVHDRDHAAFLSVLASMPDLDLYQRVYEGPGFRRHLQRGTGSHACQAALIRLHLRSGTSMLRQHDGRLMDKPSHDKQDRICPACKQPNRIESVQHVLLHCLAHERRRAALLAELAALPAAQALPMALTDDEGVVAFLRDDFMGGAQAALVAPDTFLHAVITFKIISVEQFGA